MPHIDLYKLFYVTGVKEEFDGDSEEVDDPYGQSRRHHISGWTTL